MSKIKLQKLAEYIHLQYEGWVNCTPAAEVIPFSNLPEYDRKAFFLVAENILKLLEEESFDDPRNMPELLEEVHRQHGKT